MFLAEAVEERVVRVLLAAGGPPVDDLEFGTLVVCPVVGSVVGSVVVDAGVLFGVVGTTGDGDGRERSGPGDVPAARDAAIFF